MRRIVKDLVLFTILSILSKLPFRWAQALGAWSAPALFYFASRSLKIAHTNIKLCFPQLTNNQQLCLLNQFKIEMGKLVFETPAVWQAQLKSHSHLICNVQGQEVLEQALQAPEGKIMVTPHLGNWEILGNYISARTQVIFLFKPMKDRPRVDKFIQRGRSLSGSAQLSALDAAGVRRVLMHLKNGGTVAILPDHEPKQESSGLFVPFLGQMSLTPSLPARLVKKTNAKIVFCAAKRLAQAKGFDLCFSSVSEDFYHLSLETMTLQINQAMQAMIYANPAQYLWAYRRFSRRPKGMKAVYPE